MENFKTTLMGYDKSEVKAFLDNMIKEYESLLKTKEAKEVEIDKLKLELEDYKNLEGALNRAILTAEESATQMKKVAYQESQMIISDAKKNANRILNDALYKAEKAEDDARRLRRNVIIYKNKLKSIIETQLQIIEEIDKINIKSDDEDVY